MNALDENDRARAGTLPLDPEAGTVPWKPRASKHAIPRCARCNGVLSGNGVCPKCPPDEDAAANESGRPLYDAAAIDADPFVGLAELRSRALFGYEALVAATSEPITYVWDGVVTGGDHVEISGQTASGKTTLAVLFAVARANPTGEPVRVLDRVVEPAPVGKFVLVIEEENSRRSMRRKFEEACEVLGLPVRETLDRCIFLVRTGTKLCDAAWLDALELGRRGRVALVLVDSRARVLLHGESAREEDQAAISNALHAMVEACRAPVFVISHLRKGNGSGGDLDDVSGSAQRGAGADVVIFVRAKRNAKTFKVESSTAIFAKIREEPPEWPLPVTFTLARDTAGRPTLTIVSALDGDDAPASDEPAADRIAAYLERHGTSTKNKIKTALSLNTEAIEAGISALFTSRRITKLTVNVNGRDRVAFGLRAGGDRTGGRWDAYDARAALEVEQ